MIDLISVGLSGQELVDKVNEVIAAINDMANVSSFSQLSGKPTINGVTVNGNLSLTDLGMTMEHIPGYDDLTAAMLTSDGVETIQLGAVQAAETAVGEDLNGKLDKDIDSLTQLRKGYIEGSETLVVSKGGELRKVDVDTLMQLALQHVKADDSIKGFNIQVNPSQQQGGGDGGTAAGVIAKTYAELAEMKRGGTLVPGQQYRITDYMTKTNSHYRYYYTNGQFVYIMYRSAEHPFDLIVTAVSSSEFDCMAKAVHSARDTGGYFANADLDQWQVWYDFDGDCRYGWSNHAIETEYDGFAKRFPGGDTSGAHPYAWRKDDGGIIYTDSAEPSETDKWYDDNNTSGVTIGEGNVGEHYGVIYRMIDEYNNDCPYDFKNIQFLRSPIYEGYPNAGKYLSDMLINQYNTNSQMVFENELWMYTFTAVKDVDGENYEYLDATLLNDDVYHEIPELTPQRNIVHSNVIKPWWNKQSLVAPNRLELLLNDIVFVNSIERVYSSTYSAYWHRGFQCYGNKFEHNCYGMSFGNNCTSNSVGENSYAIVMGNSCQTNSLGRHSYNITTGNSCSSNHAAGHFFNVLTGNSFSYNRLGERVCNLSVGNSVTYCVFGNDCDTINLPSYCRYVTIESGNRGIAFYSQDGLLSSSNQFQFIRVPSGVNFDKYNQVDDNADNVAGLDYPYTFGKNSQGSTSFYCEGDNYITVY